ncbi:hypothetical protein [Sideroxydans sp. CL21]|jgi:hypothetical protein|nr:hypothetical protein [Sideroxydans sp. CL21]
MGICYIVIHDVKHCTTNTIIYITILIDRDCEQRDQVVSSRCTLELDSHNLL